MSEEIINDEMEEQKFSPDEGSQEEVNEPGEDLSQKAKIVVKKDDETILEYTVEELPVLIGRKSDNHIVLEERNVSRKHAEIFTKDDEYFIRDLESTAGTRVNGEDIKEKDIHTGDIIEIGNYKLYFDSGIPEDERTVYETEEETVLEEATSLDEDRTRFYEEPEAKLVVIKAEGLEEEISLEQEELVLGRDEEVDVVVDDKRVSRRHCKILLKDGDFLIEDLGSSNGTFVNGQKVTQRRLEHGDRIQIGSAIFEFQKQELTRPVPRGRLKVFVKASIYILLIAAASFAVYKFIVSRARKPQEVIMQVSWEYKTRTPIVSSMGLGDLNGDGYINIVAADMGGYVYALDARQGGLVWNSEFRSRGEALSSPCLVDINRQDGELDVVVGGSRIGVVAIDGGTMRTIWRGRTNSAVTSSPSVADVNGDGTPDVFVGTEGGEVICFDGRQGGPVWVFNTDAKILTSPVLADFNGDGIFDVVIGSTNKRVYILDGRNGKTIWAHSGSEEPSTAACGDFNRDGTKDIAFVTSSRLIVLEGRKGSLLWDWKIPQAAMPTENDPFITSPPAVADFNGDKILDVVLSTPGGHLYCIDGSSNGERYLWDFGLSSARKSSPALADIDGDGRMDVVVGDGDGNLIVLNGRSGHVLNMLHIGGKIISSPVLGDFSSEGIISIGVGTSEGRIVAVHTQTKIRKNQILWGSFGGNRLSSGFIK